MLRCLLITPGSLSCLLTLKLFSVVAKDMFFFRVKFPKRLWETCKATPRAAMSENKEVSTANDLINKGQGEELERSELLGTARTKEDRALDRIIPESPGT